MNIGYTINRRYHFLLWTFRSAWRLHGPYTALAFLVSKTLLLGVLIAGLTHRRWLVPVRVLGAYRMYVNVFDPGISWQLISRGTREDAHVAQIRGALRPGMRGIELGANIGFFTVIEGAAVGPSGALWCIEPAPDNIDLLNRNIAANNLGSRAHVYQYLIGDTVATRYLHLASASNSHTVSTQHGGRSIEVPMVTLDHFMDEHHIEPASVDFIRMDIEGYEVMAVAGMERLFRASPHLKLFIEFHPQSYPEWGWTFERFLTHLASFGFKIRQVAKERERGTDGHETTVILDDPSIRELVAAGARWRPGGVQAFLEK